MAPEMRQQLKLTRQLRMPKWIYPPMSLNELVNM